MRSKVHPKYKAKYRVGNWSAYEQALVQRGDVTLWLSADATDAWRPAPSGRPGAPKQFSDCAIETALTLRLVFRLPLRQAEGFLRSVLSLMGVDLAAPDHTTLSRRSQSLAVECRRIPYVWADGVYFNVRLEDTDNKRQCILVLMGATRDGTKELIAITDGYRESEQSWRELLLDVRARGLTIDPELAIGDGGLGFWGAVRKVFPKTREQRCWVHKTANVLNKLPKGVQPKAKAMLHDSWMAETQAAADQAFDLFVATFAAKFPAATTCLVKDRDVLLTFYAFPAEHWMHIRTTNPVESTFATVRLRTRKTKGAGSRLACLTMVFKLAMAAQKTMESAERVSANRRGHRRGALRRRRETESRLTPYTQHLPISPTAFGPIDVLKSPCTTRWVTCRSQKPSTDSAEEPVFY